MPSARALAVAALVGLGAALYFLLWLRWPTFIVIGAGATLTVVMSLFAASLAQDPEAADAAWRAAAPDLAERERGDASEVELSADIATAPARTLDGTAAV